MPNAALKDPIPTPQDMAATLESLRGTRLLVISSNEAISDAMYEQVAAALLPVPKSARLDVVIQSNGGFPGAAFRMARLLQEYDGGFTAIVPRRAKSAATLLCLGAKQILMTEAAELGPIDTQMPHPHEPDERISALEGMKGLEAVSGFCHRFLNETMLLVLRQTGRGVKASLELATDFAAPVVRPLFEQIDPMDLGRYKRALEIGQEYSQRLLSSAGGYSEDQVADIAEQLVNGYPEHSFVIDLREAKGLGLPVDRADGLVGLLSLGIIAGLPGGVHVGTLEGGTAIAELLPQQAAKKDGIETPATPSDRAAPPASSPDDGRSDGHHPSTPAEARA